MQNTLFTFLKEKDVEFKRNEPMAKHTSVRIGGCASVMAFPNTQEKLVLLVEYLYFNRINYRVVGRMTNVLPCDEMYDGVLVCTRYLNRFTYTDEVVTAECGVMCAALIMRMARCNLGGLESLSGIPGTIGGMINSNAGAYGAQISDFLLDARIYAPADNIIVTLAKESLALAYRTSLIKNSGMLILSARLTFASKDMESIYSEVGRIKDKRVAAQPYDTYNLGSVFKRLADGRTAARLIDECGLKGFAVGGAQVSPKHAGFIVNFANATAEDYKAVIAYIKERVREKFNVELEEEIEYL